jgi:hypothetical protein
VVEARVVHSNDWWVRLSIRLAQPLVFFGFILVCPPPLVSRASLDDDDGADGAVLEGGGHVRCGASVPVRRRGEGARGEEEIL